MKYCDVIREALDAIDRKYTRPQVGQARAALDSLEAELVTLQRRVEMNELDERIQELHEERHDLESRARLGAKPTKRLAEVHAELDRLELREDELRKGITERMMARLAPADSPPGDEELRRALCHFTNLAALANTERDVSAVLDNEDMKHLARVFAAAEAHLRSQQPETEEQRAAVATLLRWFDAKAAILGAPPADIAAALATLAQTRATEEQRAERELGAWLAKEEGRTHYTMTVTSGIRVSLFRPGDTDNSAKANYPHRPTHGIGPTKAAAILNALAKTRDAEGGQ